MRTLKNVALAGFFILAAGCGKSTVHWTEQMKSPDSVNRLHAVHALKGRVNEPNVVIPALMDALKDEDTFIRRDAARALGKFGPDAADAVRPLRILLTDKEPSVRKAAAQSLQQIDPAVTAS